jgi:signal transduction histidine kinase
VVVVGTGVTVSQGGVASLLLFIAFAQVWMLLESIRYGVVGCVLLTAAVSVGITARYGFDLAVVGSVVPQMLVTLVFAIGLGLWFHVAMRRAEDHVRLLGKLHVAQAQLALTSHEAGVLAERERLAREIHDTLAQGFTSVIMQAQAATAALDVGDDGAARERLHVVENTARDNLAEARALVAAFAPVGLQDASLPQALGRLGTRFAEETGLNVTVGADGVGALPPAIEVVLLRAAQEAFANVRRHAHARSVVVRLERADRGVTLTVSDDGRGLGPEVSDGFGLAGMLAVEDDLEVVGEAADGQEAVALAAALRPDVDVPSDVPGEGRPGAGSGTRAAEAAGAQDETQGVAG